MRASMVYLHMQNLYLTFPCSLVVYQFYQKRGFDDFLHALVRLAVSKHPEPGKPKQTFPKHIKIPITYGFITKYGAHLSDGKIEQLNQTLELYIRDRIRAAFLDELDSARRNEFRFKITPVIKSILDRLGLSECAKPFDTVKKDLQRYCNRNQISYKSERYFKQIVPNQISVCQPQPINLDQYLSISELLSQKCISRQTFYKHYRKKLPVIKVKNRLYIDKSSVNTAFRPFQPSKSPVSCSHV